MGVPVHRSPVSRGSLFSEALCPGGPCEVRPHLGGITVWWVPTYHWQLTHWTPDRHDWNHYLPATSLADSNTWRLIAENCILALNAWILLLHAMLCFGKKQFKVFMYTTEFSSNACKNVLSSVLRGKTDTCITSRLCDGHWGWHEEPWLSISCLFVFGFPL